MKQVSFSYFQKCLIFPLRESLSSLGEIHQLTIVDDKKQRHDRQKNKGDDNNPNILKRALVKITSELKTKRCEDKTSSLKNCRYTPFCLGHKV